MPPPIQEKRQGWTRYDVPMNPAVSSLPVELDPTALAPAALILGCGYLGKRIAGQLITLGKSVHGSTRSPEKAQALAGLGINPLILSVTQRLTLAAITPLLDGRPLDVYYLIPPGRPSEHTAPREVIVDGITNTLAMLKRGNIRRAILTSSTAVYGRGEIGQVTAETPAAADDPRGQLLLAGEKLWLQAGSAYHVLRLSGLYGPGRVIGRQGILDHAPIVGDPQALLNLIHVDDAANLLLHMMACANPARIELGSDGHPLRRVDYYNHLAMLLHQPAPKVLDAMTASVTLGIEAQSLRQAASKHCDSTSTQQRTGWQPRFADGRKGLVHALADGQPI